LTNKKDKIPEKPLTIEELRQRWNLDNLKKYEIQAPSSSEQISNREEIQRRKEELSRGTKGLITGIYNSSSITNYQECYKYLILKFRFATNKYPSLSNQKEYRSGVKGISPDPLTIARIHGGMEINDALKNTVKTIMFNDEYNKYR